MSEKKTVKVTLVKSPIGTKADHRATLAGLGLKTVSYTHLPSPRDRTRSRMPSSA